jgi:hypothetical protein
MEDNMLILPVNGWDIEGLIQHGELAILEKLLRYPQELRFTEKGMDLLEEGIKQFLKQRELEQANKYLSTGPFSKPPEVPLEVKSEYNHEGVKGCGIYVIIDGHKGPSVALFVISHFINQFMIAVRSIRHERIEAQKNAKKSVDSLDGEKEDMKSLGERGGTSYLGSNNSLSIIPSILQRTIISLTSKIRSLGVPDGAAGIFSVVTPNKVFSFYFDEFIFFFFDVYVM